MPLRAEVGKPRYTLHGSALPNPSASRQDSPLARLRIGLPSNQCWPAGPRFEYHLEFNFVLQRNKRTPQAFRGANDLVTSFVRSDRWGANINFPEIAFAPQRNTRNVVRWFVSLRREYQMFPEIIFAPQQNIRNVVRLFVSLGREYGNIRNVVRLFVSLGREYQMFREIIFAPQTFSASFVCLFR